MGWLADRRAEHERHQQEHALAAWQADDDAIAHYLDLTRWPGQPTSDAVVLKKGEAALFSYGNSTLIETRRGQGHYEGGYSGFSFHVAKGVNYHVGGTRGHYVQGPESPTAIDVGTVHFTTQRLVFLGPRQTREWAFAKLLGVQHDTSAPRTFLQVSNRQKTSGFTYDPGHAPMIHFYVSLALAHFQGHLDDLSASLQQQLDEHRAKRPPEIAAPEGS